MLNKIFYIFIFLFLVISGCVFDDNDTTQKGEYIDSYFPLNIGLTRNYRITTFINGVEYVSPMDRIFTGTVNYENKKFYVLVSSDSDKESLYRIENDILYRYYPENSKISVPYPHEEPMLDFNKQKGESWLVVSNTFVDNDHEVVYSLQSTFMGIETMYVPAGQFQDCVRFDNYETWYYNDSSEAEENKPEFYMRYSAWYAQGVGLIKLTAEGNYFGNYLIELNDYSLSD
ncbi:MAG: hypothetical protein JXB48_18810 [Candidatus Latescibacteria bacterium]|nr:hypothetical protein [Candidatus Latescibacterota bacterium]